MAHWLIRGRLLGVAGGTTLVSVLMLVFGPNLLELSGNCQGLVWRLVIGFSGLVIILLQQMCHIQATLKADSVHFQQQARREQALNQVAQALRQSLNLDTILNQAIQAVQQSLSINLVQVDLLSDDEPSFQQYFLAGVSHATTDSRVWSHTDMPQLLSYLNQGLVVKSVHSERESARNNHEITVYCDQFVGKSILLVPLITNQKLVGVLGLSDANSHRFWTVEEEEFLLNVAGQMALAIEQAQLYQQLQYSEGRFRQILDQAAISMAVASAEGKYLQVNQAYCDLLGYTTEELLTLDFQSVTHPDDLAADVALTERLVRGELNQFKLEKRFYRKDGTLRWANLTVSLVRSVKGEPLYTISQMEDITRRKQAELALVQANAELEAKVRQRTSELAALTCQLQQQNEQLEEVSRLKSEFLTNMSHELRTPLTSILGFSDVLLQQVFGSLTDKQQEYLSRIHSSGEHLLCLINDLLDLAKIEAGKMELNWEAVNLQELCQDAVQMMEIRALDKQQHLHLELPLPVESIVVDRQRVLQILLNYLSNAVKFTPTGGKITLRSRLSSYQDLEDQRVSGETFDQSLSRIQQASSFLVLSVSDTGIGIPKEKQHLLFQKFQQIDGALNRHYEGTGLGLSLTGRLTELHGGTVSFTSQPGVGSTFSVWLPLGE